MSELARQQQAFVHALFASHDPARYEGVRGVLFAPGGRGMQVYQANGHMLAERALRAAYPVVSQCLGPQSFHDLARALWHAHPPVCGDVGRWGAALADFMQHSAQLSDTPYLADVARLEWAMHCVASAQDAQVDMASLHLLMQHDPAQVRLRWCPGCACVRSPWPVVSLLQAHRQAPPGAMPKLDGVAEQLRRGQGETAVVWREGWTPRVRTAWPGEADLMQSCSPSVSLGDALAHAPDLDFSQWLGPAVTSGLVVGVELLE